MNGPLAPSPREEFCHRTRVERRHEQPTHTENRCCAHCLCRIKSLRYPSEVFSLKCRSQIVVTNTRSYSRNDAPLIDTENRKWKFSSTQTRRNSTKPTERKARVRVPQSSTIRLLNEQKNSNKLITTLHHKKAKKYLHHHIVVQAIVRLATFCALRYS